MDLPSGSSLAAVKVAHADQIDVILLDSSDLRVIQPATWHEDKDEPRT